MTFSPKVWGDALRRLQNETPDFAFDAWIAPIQAKSAKDPVTGAPRILLGCPNSFHRDRVRLHHLAAIECAVGEAIRAETPGDDDGTALPIELMTASEWKAVEGHRIEVKAGMLRVGHARAAQAVNGASPASGASRAAAPRNASAEPEDGRPSLRAVPRDDAKGAEGAKRAARVRNASSNRAGDAPAPPEGPSFDLDGQPARRSRGRSAEPAFSFESFIVGPCNALAREATIALARQRQQSLNLLYLAGLSGMGKTHLAKAAAEEARLDLAHRAARRLAEPDTRPASQRARVIYTTAEQFTTDFVSAMRNGRNEAWAARYRGPIALLVVEDVQFLSGRTKTQQELYHTIAHVLESGGRVLLSGDRSPRDLTGLVRRHILRAKAAAGGVHLPPDCLERLVDATECAKNGKGLGSSVTEIESLLIQVVTTASLLSRPIDATLVQEAIDVKAGAATTLAPRQVAVPEIVKAVAAFFGTRPEALASRSRRRDVLVPRQLAMYLANRYTDASYTEIGRALGRDHPSVANAIKKIERQILENAPIRYQVEALSEKIDAFLADA
jgi:chromosomal replication initiator protein